jgi:antitoxin FitA
VDVSNTIHSVPTAFWEELAARAARSGRSLQQYLLDELTELASRPSLEDAIRDIRTDAVGLPAVTDQDVFGDLDADRRLSEQIGAAGEVNSRRARRRYAGRRSAWSAAS